MTATRVFEVACFDSRSFHGRYPKWVDPPCSLDEPCRASFLLLEGSLRAVIDTRLLGNGPPLGELEALTIFAGICRGVAALHEHDPSWAHRFVIKKVVRTA